MKRISIVVPAHNEEKNVAILHDKIREIFKDLEDYGYELIFVNDGSTDATQCVLEALAKEFQEVKFIEFSRNFGHQMAVKAGLDHAKGDAVISMDADLQHPPELIPEMIHQWENGNDIVYTVRTYPKEISKFKKRTSDLYYNIITKLSDIEIEKGSGSDYRLIDAQVLTVVKDMNEDNLFLRGLFKWIGFRQVGVAFTAGVREHGESKYNLKKMIKFAVTGVTAFSVKPLYIATYLGVLFSILSIIGYSVYVFYALFTHTEISGWASLIMTVVFFGGMQLIILGILGLYIGKIFKQVKNRPAYIIRSKNTE